MMTKILKLNAMAGICAVVFFILLSGCAASGAPKDKFRNVYEIYVGSFYDMDGDGMGDLRGVTEKLDYIANPETGLGADAIWLMPFNPSPSYHKYDVTDYMQIDPQYGTMADFDALAAECEKRGVMLIMDLVINHTSAQHPWFTAAANEIKDGNALNYANYYNFADEKTDGTYYPLDGGGYYEAVFWDQMPDLNMDSEPLREQIKAIAEFWLNKGVGGFRLDAAMHIYHTREENLAFWRWFSDMCRAVNPDVYLVAEVWANDPEILPYYATGLDSLFNFGFADEEGVIANSVNRGKWQDLANRVEAYGSRVRAADPGAVMANFLSNHDMNRSAGFIENGEAGLKLAAAVYMLMPGSSYIYYGEEIGMTGKGKDENKRMPFVWSVNGDTGLTTGPTGGEAETVTEGAAEQLAREGSLLNTYRQIIAVKNKYPAIARGEAAAVSTGVQSVCAYEIAYNGERLLIAHNLINEAQTVLLPEGGTYKLAETINGAQGGFALDGGGLTLPGFGTAVIEISAS